MMSRKISIQLNDVVGHSESFDNLKALESFLKNEQEFWTSRSSGLKNHQYFNQQGYLQNAIQIIDGWKANLDSWDENTFNNSFNSLRQNQLNNFQSNWLWSGHTFVQAWLEAYRIHEQTGLAFINYIQKKQIDNIQNYNYLKGYLLAYEFEMQDESFITKRRSLEKASFSQLRNRLDETTNTLVKEVDEFKSGFNSWHNQTIKTIESSIKTQNDGFDDAQNDRSGKFEQYMSECKTKIENLENTYQEKLRLEKPAQYWSSKAKEYKIQGDKWAKWFGGILGAGFVIFVVLFSCWLSGKEVGLKLDSLQGAIIFATVLTIYAIAIQSVSKMVFSSYHLQRDAEEREQLAFVYLALTNEEKQIDDESRKIVLQAIFSRADTGLLKDSSPTMPSGGLVDLMKTAKPH